MDEAYDLYPLVSEHIDHLLLSYHDKIQDGSFSVSDAVAMSGQAFKCFFEFARSVPELSVAQQKAAVLSALDRFYAEKIAPLDIPRLPNVIENAFVDPAIGGVAHDLASWLFDVFASESPKPAAGA